MSEQRLVRRAVLARGAAAGLMLFAAWRLVARFLEAYAAREMPPRAPDEETKTPANMTPEEALEVMMRDGCSLCGIGYTALPSKTFLRHYTELDPERGSR